MKICDALRREVREELNLLYTEPPKGGAEPDAGWFCREHALHVAALAEMLGERSTLCVGELIVRNPTSSHDILLSRSNGGDVPHAWCRVEGQAPVDASVTLRYWDRQQPDFGVICPDDSKDLAGFELQYQVGADEEAFKRLAEAPQKLIAYNELSSKVIDVMALLAEPFSFLARPPVTLIDSKGPEVFFAITKHLYKIATGKSKPIMNAVSQADMLDKVIKRNINARAFVASKLKEG